MPQAIRVVDSLAELSDFQGTPAAGQLLRFDGAKWGPATLLREVPAGAVDGSNLTFTLTATPSPSSSLRVYLNGLLQRTGAGGDYSVTGAVVSFVSAPGTGDVVEATYLS